MAKEKAKMVARFTIEKFRGDYKSREEAIKAEGKPFEILKLAKNLLLNEGINLVWTLVCGGAGTVYDETNAYIGVGDGDAAAEATQAGLQGTNKAYSPMDTGYPGFGSNQKATWRSTFAGGEANFEWKEITVANGNSDSATNLNRKVESMGTKAAGSTWAVSLEITLS